MKSTFGPIGIGVLFLALIMASPVAADMVTVAVTGRVTEASDFATIDDGSAVTGYYRYDDATSDGSTSAYNGLYQPVTFSLTFQGGSTISTDAAQIRINNNSSGIGTVDEYVVAFPYDFWGVPSQNTMTGAFAGLALDAAGGSRIYLNNDAGTAWDSDALPDPESVLDVMTYDDSSLYFGTWELSSGVWIIRPPWRNLSFEITDLSVVTVPVPGALGLVVLGLGSSGWLLRRRNGSA